MNSPWEGFWQVLYQPGDESIVRFRDTTTAVRPALGFSVYAGGHFIELRATAARRPPEGWPPTRVEAVEMLRAFRALAGRSSWREEGDRWEGTNTTTMASDPRLEGGVASCVLEIDGDHASCQRTMPDGTSGIEAWRRLSGAGSSPLAGAWESGDPDDLWMYLVTAGHFGVIRTSSDRPRSPASGETFTDDEIYALWGGFGANAGARLETYASFDHWPFLGQVAGYEVRKHETFRIEGVETDRFVANLPPYEDPGDGWRRIG